MELRGHFVFQNWSDKAGRDLVYNLIKNEHHHGIYNLPYTEYYIGGHELFKTTIAGTGQDLVEHFQYLDGSKIGENCYKHFGTSIPFIIKVLAVKKPQPFKCHLDLQLSRKFNQEFPREYQIVGGRRALLAPVGRCTVLIGLQTIDHLIEVVNEVKELEALVDKSLLEAFVFQKKAPQFKAIFEKLLWTSRRTARCTAHALIQRLSKIRPEKRNPIHKLDLMKKIHKEYPGDIGFILPYLCHCLHLDHGQVIFIPERIPYSLFEGDMIECSNLRDNSPCAALGQKLKIEEFMETVNFNFQDENDIINMLHVPGVLIDLYVKQFSVSEFPECVISKCVLSSIFNYVAPKCSSFSIIVVTNGEGRPDFGRIIERGSCLLLYAEGELMVTVFRALEFYQFSVNV